MVSPFKGLVIPAGHPLTFSHPEGEGDTCLLVRGRWLRPLARRLRAVPFQPAAVSSLYSAISALARGEAAEIDIEGALGHVISILDHQGGSASHREIARRLLFELEVGFARVPTVQSLADAVGVSVFRACRAFRKATGRTIHGVLDEIRLAHAWMMLLDSETGLAAIAATVGFSSQAHFTTRMRRRYGVTPGAIRKRRLRPDSESPWPDPALSRVEPRRGLVPALYPATLARSR